MMSLPKYETKTGRSYADIGSDSVTIHGPANGLMADRDKVARNLSLNSL